MICPHCGISARIGWKETEVASYDDYVYSLDYFKCLECHKISIKFRQKPINALGYGRMVAPPPLIEKMLIPETTRRKKIPTGVEDEYLIDYNEAVKLLPHSSAASAAYSRRVLQHYIEKKHKIKRTDLQQEIQELKKLKVYPSELVDLFDYIRHYGKFGSHATTDQLTGEIIEVDNDEAELLLSILEEMFDYDYERPKRIGKVTKKMQKKIRDSKSKKI